MQYNIKFELFQLMNHMKYFTADIVLICIESIKLFLIGMVFITLITICRLWGGKSNKVKKYQILIVLIILDNLIYNTIRF